MFAAFTFFFSLLCAVNANSPSPTSKRGYSVVGAVIAAVLLAAIFVLTVSLYCCFRKSIGRRFCNKEEAATAAPAPSCRSEPDTESMDATSLKARINDSPTISEKKVDVNIDLEKAAHVQTTNTSPTS